MHPIQQLASEVPEIEKRLIGHPSDFMPRLKTVYNDPMFIEWKSKIQFQLQQLIQDNFIVDILSLLNGFNGWNDEQYFHEVAAKLQVLADNIKRYEPKEVDTHKFEQGGDKAMKKNAIEQFIENGVKLQDEYRQHKKDLATSGIADLSGDMPAGMHEWMNSIKIHVKRHLTNHPLYDDMNSVLFHNKNGIKDYDKMMGLLKAISQDMASKNGDIVEDPRQPLRNTIARNMIPNKLPQNSRYLLKEIVESENPIKMIHERFEKSSFQEDELLRSLLRELEDKEYIKISLWADDLPQYIQINNSARTYFEHEEKDTRMVETDSSNRILKDFDVFISHSNADKIGYVNELFLTIKKLGINIFYDSDVLSWGDNWKDTILRGTEQSEFAIIVISESFFGREWTEKELSELLSRQNNIKQKIILPLLHNITVEQLKEKYPSLQYIQSISSDKYSMEQISILLAKELIKRYKE
jgi:hypothetical protein